MYLIILINHCSVHGISFYLISFAMSSFWLLVFLLDSSECSSAFKLLKFASFSSLLNFILPFVSTHSSRTITRNSHLTLDAHFTAYKVNNHIIIWRQLIHLVRLEVIPDLVRHHWQLQFKESHSIKFTSAIDHQL